MTRIGDIGTPAIVSKNTSLAFYVSLALIKIKSNDVLPKYLYYYIQTNDFKRELWKRTIHNAFPIKINKNEIGKCKIKLLSLNKQEEIIKILELIDNKISVNKSKLQALKKYKEGLVQIILKDTVSNWQNKSQEGVKLSHYLKPYKKLSRISDTDLVLVTLSKEGISDKTDRYNREFLVKDGNKKYRIVEFNDLIYNPANLKFGVICINHLRTALVSPIYETFKIININPNLLEAIVTFRTFIKYALKFEEGTVYERKSVNPTDLLNIRISINSDKSIKYDSTLKLLETLIRQTMLEHEKLIKLKNYLLNSMFI